ncbi:hypothetical protein HHL11_31620 [Ramlibacter sp. G-1-2-2]|uniref:Uncharacterized protein n=1 Tax=Ramlibacter agri TaxID=2728837 RepID=A0A848HFV3_9BURK|nr:hypothetical protein [Ramlibacter agri]NML48340.1 hypothetical protein [Ramlibacter agri]
MLRILQQALLCAFLAACALAQAQDNKPDDYGGLASYQVPADKGGPAEFRYCVLYAKRAWRMANMVREGSISMPQVEGFARKSLGRKAAEEEIQDFERLQSKEYPTPSALAAERFMRCATALRLDPQPRQKPASEFCFRSIEPLDLAARLRADGKAKDAVWTTLSARYPKAGDKFLNDTVNLAFEGPSIGVSTLIEDTFSNCFARAGERK